LNARYDSLMFDSPELKTCFTSGYDQPSVALWTEKGNGVETARWYCFECAPKAGVPVHEWALRKERAEKAARKKSN
jgi:hypothetical protein